MTPPLAEDGGAYLPLVKGLALSLALHIAILSVWNAELGSHETRTLVIQSRLVMPANNERDQLLPPESPSREPALSQTAPASTQTMPPAPQVLAIPSPALPRPAVEAVSAPAPTPPAPVTSAPPNPAAPQAGPPMGAPLPSPSPSLPLAVDSTWYPTRKVDTPAKVISGGAPEYPKLARQLGQEGWVVVQVRVNKLGRAEEVQVIEAHPAEVFNDHAALFYRMAHYSPAIKDGRPVNFETRFRVTFNLEDER